MTAHSSWKGVACSRGMAGDGYSSCSCDAIFAALASRAVSGMMAGGCFLGVLRLAGDLAVLLEGILAAAASGMCALRCSSLLLWRRRRCGQRKQARSISSNEEMCEYGAVSA